MRRELTHYHPRGDEIVAAFVAGINAYIELTEREPARLPLEFRILGIKPGKWTPEVVVSRHNGLFRNVTQEVQYAQLVHLLGSDRARELLNLHPGHPLLESDESVDLSLIGDPVLDAYKASRAVVRFHPEDVEPLYRNRDRRGRKAAALAASVQRLSDGTPPADDPELQGSNNWVVSGDHTQSGSAIMANDPHRSMQLPSLRYWVHLVAPGWNVIGAGEPALPGVSVGHNERGAWGFTIFPIDQEDLYVYETDPANPSRYRYGDGWEVMKTIRETIAVKGRTAVEAELKFTRHGPVIYEDPRHHRAYALAGRLARGGNRPIPCQPATRPGHKLGRIPRSLPLVPDSVGEHGLGRRGRPHRLAGRGPGATPQELGRALAGARRRPLRVGRLSPRSRTAARDRPATGLVCLSQSG